jgi:hypothetical protein
MAYFIVSVWSCLPSNSSIDALPNSLMSTVAETGRGSVQVSGERTKKAAVTKALHEFIAGREKRCVADLFGKLEWDSAFDYKAERTRRAE